MRSTLITSVLAASVLSVGFAATAGATESGDGGEIATPTTVPFNLDSLGLTPEQMTCLMGSATNVDLQDMTAIMDLMTQCGINPMDLVAGATPTVPGVATTVFVPCRADRARCRRPCRRGRCARDARRRPGDRQVHRGRLAVRHLAGRRQ